MTDRIRFIIFIAIILLCGALVFVLGMFTANITYIAKLETKLATQGEVLKDIQSKLTVTPTPEPTAAATPEATPGPTTTTTTTAAPGATNFASPTPEITYKKAVVLESEWGERYVKHPFGPDKTQPQTDAKMQLGIQKLVKSWVEQNKGVKPDLKIFKELPGMAELEKGKKTLGGFVMYVDCPFDRKEDYPGLYQDRVKHAIESQNIEQYLPQEIMYVSLFDERVDKWLLFIKFYQYH